MFIRRFKNNLMYILFLIFVFVLIGLNLSIGYYFYHENFVINCVSELFGILASIIVTILVIGQYYESQRRKQWKRVKQITYNSILSHFSEIVIETQIKLSVGIGDRYKYLDNFFKNPSNVNYKINEELKTFISLELKSITEEKLKCPPAEATKTLYKRIKTDLDYIQHTILPRILSISNDKELIDILIEFEFAKRNLEHGIRAHNTMPPVGYPLSKLIDLYCVLQRTYEIIYLRTNQ